ncbi:MAG: 16S rRNA (uracil(1498)-N(3))-methyltransferase [Casimicrobiaceae bacterium]
MAAPRFYVAGLGPDLVGAEYTLPDAVAHHAVRVNRLGPGDALVLFDGSGGEYAGTLVVADRRAARARIDAFDPVERESPLDVVLVQTIIANDAMDYAVRKAVELGVSEIAPVTSSRSAPLPAGERADRRLAHWRQVAIAACEQCGRNRVPPVRAPVDLGEFAFAGPESVPGGAAPYADDVDHDHHPTLHATPRGPVPAPAPARIAYICAPGCATPLAAVPRVPRCAVVVGPEGGFTAAEVAMATGRGAVAVSLGPRVLRAETAAVVVLAVLQARCGDLG